MRRLSKALLLAPLCFAIYVCISGWFFFFLPSGLFSSDDRRTVAELQKNQDWPGLLKLSTEKTASSPDNASWWFHKGWAQFNLHQYADCIPAFERAVALQPQFPEALNNMGSARARLGRYDEAIPNYEASVKANPEYTLAWRNLVHSYSRVGKPDKAWDAHQVLAKLNPAAAQALQKQYLIPQARPAVPEPAVVSAAPVPAPTPAPTE